MNPQDFFPLNGIPTFPLKDRSKEADRLAFEIDRERTRREAKRAVDDEEVPPAEIPAVQSLRDRLLAPQRPLVWRIDGLMQANHRVLLSAQSKAGKSTTVVNVVRALVDERALLFDHFQVERVNRVTILDFEMADDEPGQLDDWYRDARLGHPERVQIVPLRGRPSAFNILDARCRQRWAGVLRGSDVVVWDCVSTVVMALGLDENLDAQRLLIAFDELLKAAGITEAIVVQHMGHNNERARGSSGFLAWPDVLWTVVRDEKTNKRFFRAEGRGVSVAESELTFNPQTYRLAVSGGSRREMRVWNALDAVAGVLKDGPKNTTEIETELAGDVGRDDIRAALAKGLTLGGLSVSNGARNSKDYDVKDASRLKRPDDCPF